MSIEKMREEFEAAFVEEMVLRCGEGFRSSVRMFFAEKEPDGTYSNPIAHAGWWAWQASREALLEKQAQEQEEFLAHLADFEQEDTFHG
jgi:hypothetical protein